MYNNDEQTENVKNLIKAVSVYINAIENAEEQKKLNKEFQLVLVAADKQKKWEKEDPSLATKNQEILNNIKKHFKEALKKSIRENGKDVNKKLPEIDASLDEMLNKLLFSTPTPSTPIKATQSVSSSSLLKQVKNINWRESFGRFLNWAKSLIANKPIAKSQAVNSNGSSQNRESTKANLTTEVPKQSSNAEIINQLTSSASKASTVTPIGNKPPRPLRRGPKPVKVSSQVKESPKVPPRHIKPSRPLSEGPRPVRINSQGKERPEVPSRDKKPKKDIKPFTSPGVTPYRSNGRKLPDPPTGPRR